MVTELQSALWEQAANTSFKQHRRRCSQQFKRRAWCPHRSVAQTLGAAVIRDVAHLSNAESLLLLTSGLLESRCRRGHSRDRNIMAGIRRGVCVLLCFLATSTVTYARRGQPTSSRSDGAGIAELVELPSGETRMVRTTALIRQTLRQPFSGAPRGILVLVAD
ncbi:hypothetical protein MTO96_037283, partial [Rhipicephalus appendiculatus]